MTMIIGIRKIEGTKNGYVMGKIVTARKFVKAIDADYFLKYRNFICNADTATRISKLLKRARRAHDGEGWRFTINKGVPSGMFYVNGKF